LIRPVSEPVTRTEVSFGAGTVISNQVFPVYKTWSTPRVKDLIFTVWNDDHPEGVAMTQKVTVVSLLDSTIQLNGSSGKDANTGMSWAEAKRWCLRITSPCINAGHQPQGFYLLKVELAPPNESLLFEKRFE